MLYNEFVNSVAKDITSFLEYDENRQVFVKDVRKNNGVLLKGLTIKSDSEQIAPTIYLEQFYEQYSHTGDYDEVLRTIAKAYENSKLGSIPGFSADDLSENNIYGVLVNTDSNEELLRDIPSVHVLDGRFSVVFRYSLDKFDDKASVLITDSIAEAKKLTPTKLLELALCNTGKHQEISLEPMENIICSVIGMDYDELANKNKACPMYVLSNTDNIYGSFMILRPDVEQKLMSTFQGDIVVIPSSVHELILIDSELVSEGTIEHLNEIITSVNKEVVSQEDFLDNRYFVLERNDVGYAFANELANVS